MVSKQPADAAAHVRQVFGELGWPSSVPLLLRVLVDMETAFAGRRQGYLPIDMRYHDFGHTLQATVCVADLVLGQQKTAPVEGFGQRAAELCVIAALLHDVGFLKTAGDLAGTGAKYTMVHEYRSCDFARAYLPELGLDPPEIEDVCSAISCTGPRNLISAHSFRHAAARRMACLLVTADYVAQMSAPDYADKLDFLYAEFVEAFHHEKIPEERRPYHSATELKLKTPDFWEKFVRPMLDTEAAGVQRFLSVTGQPNPYMQAIADNIAEVRRRGQPGLVHT
ncbi:MAG: hypothetical protein C0502_08740 [Opitutus sp.]|nr:hypothetical protein [Opitutus sp.]